MVARGQAPLPFIRRRRGVETGLLSFFLSSSETNDQRLKNCAMQERWGARRRPCSLAEVFRGDSSPLCRGVPFGHLGLVSVAPFLLYPLVSSTSLKLAWTLNTAYLCSESAVRVVQVFVREKEESGKRAARKLGSYVTAVK